jgi:hypothetical protein
VADEAAGRPKNAGGQIVQQKNSLTGRKWDGVPPRTEESTDETGGSAWMSRPKADSGISYVAHRLRQKYQIDIL